MWQELAVGGVPGDQPPGYCCGRMINDGQCRAARAFLRITQQQLADSAGVSLMTIKRFESGSDARMSIANRIERALAAAGIELIDDGKPSPGGGSGLRLRRRSDDG